MCHDVCTVPLTGSCPVAVCEAAWPSGTSRRRLHIAFSQGRCSALWRRPFFRRQHYVYNTRYSSSHRWWRI